MAHEQFRQHESTKKALAHLVEETGEVLAAAGKTIRFGFLSTNPLLPPEQRETNRDWLCREIDDLKLAITKFEEELEREDMSAYELAKAIANGHDCYMSSSSEFVAIQALLIDPGYAKITGAERHPNGKRWVGLTSKGYALVAD